MFIDEVEISLKAGKGGNGVATFRHEKFVPKGGPDGGDGGNGGNIYFETDFNTDTLSFFNLKKIFKAEDGENGKNKKMYGKYGKNLFLKIPPGTTIYEVKEGKTNKIIDLIKNKEKLLICKGGKGGLGNIHFKSSTNQTPKEFTKGELGERKRIKLELSMIADVGIIGLPNSGKSSLISVVSSAKPKIANYPFTTIIPNLGVVNHKGNKFIVADIPGLIENASCGKGLGHRFLKHIKRNKMLIYLLDISAKDFIKDYQIITNELKNYDKELIKKPKLIVFNKIDLISDKFNIVRKKINKFFIDENVQYISVAQKKNINKLLDLIINNIKLDKKKSADII